MNACKYRWSIALFALVLWNNPTWNEQSSSFVVHGFQQRYTTIGLERRRLSVNDSPLPTGLQLIAKDSSHGDNNCSIKSLLSSFAFASTILLSSAPAIASNDHGFVPSSHLVASSDSLDVSELVKSLSPATASRPQIPFPTQEALREAAQKATAPAMLQQRQQQQQQPVPQENLLQENSYTLPALVSLDVAAQKTRPYNGADVLVLQVWRDNPQTQTNPDSKSLGGAKIPIGALVGGFPVRVSLGPQNAASTPEWNKALSSQSLWVTSAICRETNDNPEAASRVCSSDYSLPILEATGFSKFISISAMQPTTDSSGSTTVSGLRAPVSLVLGQPTR